MTRSVKSFVDQPRRSPSGQPAGELDKTGRFPPSGQPGPQVDQSRPKSGNAPKAPDPAPASSRSLTALQQQFCEEYILDRNATAAYLRAVKNCGVAGTKQTAHKLMQKSHVQARIAELAAATVVEDAGPAGPDAAPLAELGGEWWTASTGEPHRPAGDPRERERFEQRIAGMFERMSSYRNGESIPTQSIAEYDPLDEPQSTFDLEV